MARGEWHTIRYLAAAPLCYVFAALMPFSVAFAGDDWFRPNGSFRIVPPLSNEGYADPSSIKKASYALTRCNYLRSTYPLFQKPLRIHEVTRIVTVSVPKSINLTDKSIVNSIVVSAWYYAWRNCFAWIEADRRILGEFSGVSVVVTQQSKKIIEAERTIVSSTGVISPAGFYHVIFEQQRLADEAKALAEREAQDAELRRKRELARAQAEAAKVAFWNKVRLFFWTIAGVIALGFIARYGPKTVAYIRYFLSPHPANSIIIRATQGDLSQPVNGLQLMKAIRHEPKNSTDESLATRDLHALARRMDRETEYQRASEVLVRKTVEMEEARARVEELKKNKEDS